MVVDVGGVLCHPLDRDCFRVKVSGRRRDEDIYFCNREGGMVAAVPFRDALWPLRWAARAIAVGWGVGPDQIIEFLSSNLL